MELPVEVVKEGDVVEPVDDTTEELPKLVGRVDEPKLLGERGVDVDSDRVRSVDGGIAELPILLDRLMGVLDDMSAERGGPGLGLGRDTVKPSLWEDGKTKEPPVVVDVPGRSVAELPDGLVSVTGALEAVGTFEPVGSAEDVPPGVLGIMLELSPGRVLDETTDKMTELMVFDGTETEEGERIVESVETEVDNPVLIVTTLVEAGNDGYGLCGWLIGRGKLDVSDDVGPDDGGLTDDETKGPDRDSADEVDPNVEDPTAAPEEGIVDSPTEETIDVTSTVLVGNVLNRLGGAILSSHSVVLFTTEK